MKITIKYTDIDRMKIIRHQLVSNGWRIVWAEYNSICFEKGF